MKEIPYEVRLGWKASTVQRAVKRHPEITLPRRVEIFEVVAAAAASGTASSRDPVIQVRASEAGFLSEVHEAVKRLYADRNSPQWWVLRKLGGGGTSEVPGGLRKTGKADSKSWYRSARWSFDVLAQLAENELGTSAPKADAMKKAAKRMGLIA